MHSRSNTLDWPTARRLAVGAHLDPRTIFREYRTPGSVRGAAGARAHEALVRAGLRGDAGAPVEKQA